MLILVTGASGFIGSHVAVQLLQAGHDLIAVGHSETGQMPMSLKRVEMITNKRIIFNAIDCCNLQQLETVFKAHQIDAVIHLASYKCVRDSFIQPLKYYYNNLASSLVLLQVCDTYNVRKFIFASSYLIGDSIDRSNIEAGIHTTNQISGSPYIRCKSIVEQMLADMANSQKNWKIISLRVVHAAGAHASGLIGEDQVRNPYNLIPRIAQTAIGAQSHLNIYGSKFETSDGSPVNSFIHVMDLARLYAMAVDRLEKMDDRFFEIYNVSNGHEHSVLEVVNKFEKVTDKKIKTALVECDSSAKDPKINRRFRVLDAKELGLKCELDMDQICKHFWNWQRKNPNGYSTLSNRLFG